MSVKVGDWPKLPTKAERISTVTGSFRTLGLVNFRWRPESVARTNGDSEIGGRPEICGTQLIAFTASSTVDLDEDTSHKCCKYRAK